MATSMDVLAAENARGDRRPRFTMRRIAFSVRVTAGISLAVFVLLGAVQFQTEPPRLTVVPSSGPLGTVITVIGENFTGDGSVAADGITVEDFPAGFEPADVATDGRFSANNIIVTGPGLGPKTVAVTDSGGRVASTIFTVTRPTIALNSASATMGETVTITGAGWVPSSSVLVVLNANQQDLAVSVVVADTAGGFETTIDLPRAVGIGSKEVSFRASDQSYLGNTALPQVLTVPAPKLTLSPTAVEAGAVVTLTASGFPPSAALSAFTIGSLDIRDGVLTTDSVGSLTISFTVPGLIGGQLVSVNIGGTTVSTSILVENTAPRSNPDPTPNPTVAKSTIDIFANLINNDNNLVRIFRFDNSTKTWDFYDPRPEFAAANSLNNITSGSIVWVNLSFDQEFQGQDLFAGWNQISLR